MQRYVSSSCEILNPLVSSLTPHPSSLPWATLSPVWSLKNPEHQGHPHKYETCSLALFPGASWFLLGFLWVGEPGKMTLRRGEERSKVRERDFCLFLAPWTLHPLLEVLRILHRTLFGLPLEVRVCCCQQLCGHRWNCCATFTNTTKWRSERPCPKISFVI